MAHVFISLFSLESVVTNTGVKGFTKDFENFILFSPFLLFPFSLSFLFNIAWVFLKANT